MELKWWANKSWVETGDWVLRWLNELASGVSSRMESEGAVGLCLRQSKEAGLREASLSPVLRAAWGQAGEKKQSYVDNQEDTGNKARAINERVGWKEDWAGRGVGREEVKAGMLKLLMSAGGVGVWLGVVVVVIVFQWKKVAFPKHEHLVLEKPQLLNQGLGVGKVSRALPGCDEGEMGSFGSTERGPQLLHCVATSKLNAEAPRGSD